MLHSMRRGILKLDMNTDSLQIFGSNPTTLEDIIKEKGQLMKKGTLSEDGDFEVWADGSATRREKPKTEEKEEKA